MSRQTAPFFISVFSVFVFNYYYICVNKWGKAEPFLISAKWASAATPLR